MDQKLIDNWNAVVPSDGIVICAGDFIWTGNIDWIRSVVERLNGDIYLIYGNHDLKNRLDRDVVKDIFGRRTGDVADIIVQDSRVSGGHSKFFVSHYPHLFWERGAYHLHGHVHSGPNSKADEVVPFHHMRYDIGVDNNKYFPISYRELKEVFEEQTELKLK